MKSIYVLFMTLCMTSLQALYVGNPYLPGAVAEGLYTSEESIVRFELGYQADYVIDRRLKSYDKANRRIDEFQSQWNQGVITCTLADRVDGYVSVGSMQATFSNRPLAEQSQRTYQTGYKTAWGFGGRVIVYEWGSSCIGVEGSYQYTNPPMKWDRLNGQTFATDGSLHYQEWQVSLGISKQIEMLIPYLVGKYSNVNAKVTHINSDLDLGSSSFKMTNRDHFGMAVGCTFTTGKFFDLTLESRFIDEQGVSLAGNMTF